ncbi:hypothetical protein H5158_12900 [Pseudoalteromonas sp. SR45-6]|uniref:hypothetical protein n=1 Tax=Pseudoalteromonas sp. SR45-6 TaxID=2760927 RepID=UPI0016033F34|nr:hypothetical protein [Pseudoalteromonas sp. SR45-6]MBB1342533.1 hypothetical protein [Pseudoalteromonas sp. SR45-6]
MVTIKKIKQLNSIADYFQQDKVYNLIFKGSPIDDRTTQIADEIEKHSNKSKVLEVSIAIDKYSLSIGNKDIRLLELGTFLNSLISNCESPAILIEATSLDFSEILYLIDALSKQQNVTEIAISYIEPDEYSDSPSHIKETSEFLLSESNQKFVGLPLFALNSQEQMKSHLVAILGFENHRLGQALEEDDGASFSNMHAMIGIPAFNPGWENRSILRHLDHFESIKTRLHSYPATNPYELNKVLEALHKGYDRMVIASMGTKPAALAAAIFLINNVPKNTRQKQVGAIYDFPKKKQGRSVGIGEIYEYQISIK